MPGPRKYLLAQLLLPTLIVLPAVALLRTGWDWHWFLGYALFVNLLTYGAYAWDKRRASSGGWRVAEFQLHLLELLGGWPAAWVAQGRLRHKNAKRSYQVVFWLIVIAYQAAALLALSS